MTSNDDINTFKEEVLLRIIAIEKSVLNIQPKSAETNVTELITKYDRLTERLNEIEKIANKDKVLIESIHSLKTWESKAQDQITTSEIRINGIHRELKDTVSRYDKIFMENLFIPGVIGENNCRYRNMREFIEVYQCI